MSDSTLTLRAGDISAEIDPALGGSLLNLRWQGADILRAAPDAPDDPRQTACFPLVPFAGRLGNGETGFGSAPIPPNVPGEAHPLHGIGWQRPWTMDARTDASVSIVMQHPGDDSWPWAFQAQLQLALVSAEAITGGMLRLSVRNLDRRPMPASLGLHPYFPVQGPGGPARIGFPADHMWVNENGLPKSKVRSPLVGVAVDAALDPSVLDIDACFGGAIGKAIVLWPDAVFEMDSRVHQGRRETPVEHLQLYAPKGADFFCLEPMSARPDPFGVADQSSNVMPFLRRRETLDLTMTFEVRAP